MNDTLNRSTFFFCFGEEIGVIYSLNEIFSGLVLCKLFQIYIAFYNLKLFYTEF